MIKENQAKSRVAAVPKLQAEVKRKRIFVEEEMHNLERVEERNRDKEKVFESKELNL